MEGRSILGIYTEGREILKDVIKLANGIDDVDLKNKLLELQSKFYELNDENRNLGLRLDNEKQ